MQDMETEARKNWLGLLAKAPQGRVNALMKDAGHVRPDFEWLRRPEVGSVMMRGRIGGTGAPFNLGEMTVTRCSLKLATGEVGHGYVQGRSKSDAEVAALVDAIMQTADAVALQAAVIAPLAAEKAAEDATRARKAAATKVEFFTMARGED